jgi:hypothetical protein
MTDLLVLALTGQVTDHHRFQLRGPKEQVVRLDEGIDLGRTRGCGLTITTYSKDAGTSVQRWV